MNSAKHFRLPLGLLLLDGIGTALLVLGITEWVDATSLIAESWQFENYQLTMIVFGGLLMLPLFLHIFAFIKENSRNNRLQ